MRYLTLALICSLTAGVLFLVLYKLNNSKRVASESAKIALMATVDNPESVAIRAISEPDSVYGRDLISPDELNVIGSMMMKVGDSISRRTDNLEDLDYSDPHLSDLMNRQMAAMSVVRSYINFPDGKKDGKDDFSGWKVKIDYDAKNKDGIGYRAEYWAILDKSGNHVVKSFELPIF